MTANLWGGVGDRRLQQVEGRRWEGSSSEDEEQKTSSKIDFREFNVHLDVEPALDQERMHP